MPRIGFKTENKTAAGSPQFPKLKLKKDEIARIVMGLEEAEMQFVHTLRKPVIENGKAKMVRDQKGVLQMEKDFVSRPLCTGNMDVLEKKGADPANCKMCALAKQDSEMADPPEMRFAINVFQYRTKPGSANVQSPFSGETVVWSFPAGRFNKIIDITEEFGDLTKHDLVLGPCENETFQKFEIKASPKAEWRTSDENKKFLVQSFKENKFEDLALACGQRKEERWLDKDIQDIKDAWMTLRSGGTSDPANDTSLEADLNSYLEKDAVAQEVWAAPEENEAATAAEEKPAKKAAAAKPKSPEPTSIESLLDEVTEGEASEGAGDDEEEDGLGDDFASFLNDLNTKD